VNCCCDGQHRFGFLPDQVGVSPTVIGAQVRREATNTRIALADTSCTTFPARPAALIKGRGLVANSVSQRDTCAQAMDGEFAPALDTESNRLARVTIHRVEETQSSTETQPD